MIAPLISVLLVALQVVGAELPLDSPREEARAQRLMREIRCVVCENEPVSQSTADIAVDMRRSIRSQIEQGQTDGQIRKFFSDRYGEFVLFRPSGWLIWTFPFALLLGVGGWLAFRAFRRRPRGLAPLPDDELGA